MIKTILRSFIVFTIFLLALLALLPMAIRAQPILFQDDFEQDKSYQWDIIAGDWTRQFVGGSMRYGLVLPTPSSGVETQGGDFSWTNYELSFDMFPLQGVDRNVFFRVNDQRTTVVPNLNLPVGYGLHMYQNHMWLQKFTTTTGIEPVDLPISLPDGVSTHFRIQVNDNNIKVFLGDDTSPTIDYTDNDDPFLSGRIALALTTGAVYPTEVWFDNVTVTAIDTPITNDFVILGEEGVWVKQNATIYNGDVGASLIGSGPFLDSGVETSIGNGVQITNSESDVYGDSVKLKQGSQVQDIFYNDLSGLGTVLGDENTPLDLPVVSDFPTVPVFSPGTIDVEVPANDNQSITPGSYGDLVVRSGATLTFSAGEYNFNSWDIRKNANIYFDGSVEIRIADKLGTRENVEVRPSPSATIDASDVVVYITGINGNNGNLGATPKAAKFGVQNIIEANVYVENGTLLLKQNTVATGAFLGKWVIGGVSTEFTHDSGFLIP